MTKFGISQLKNQTPKILIWIFRIIFIISSSAIVIIANDPSIDPVFKVRAVLYLTTFEGVFWTLMHFFGIQKEEITSIENQDHSTK